MLMGEPRYKHRGSSRLSQFTAYNEWLLPSFFIIPQRRKSGVILFFAYLAGYPLRVSRWGLLLDSQER